MSAHLAPFNLHSTFIEAVDPGDAGTITVDRNPCYVPLVSAGAETRTLGRPTRVGVLAFLYFKTDGGDITLTVTGGYTEAGDTTFTFSDAGQLLGLVSCFDGTNYHWRASGVASSAALTAADETAIDATYDAVEQAVLENIRTRQGEIEAALQKAGILS